MDSGSLHTASSWPGLPRPSTPRRLQVAGIEFDAAAGPSRVTGPGREDGGAWMAGSSPAMTMEGRGPETSPGLIEPCSRRATWLALPGSRQVELGDDSGDFFI